MKVAEGDEIAFGLLFKMYYNQLGDYILRITESRQMTQEIVQDVFLKVWVMRSSLCEVECFNAYLFAIARNHAFNCLKQMAREKNRKAAWVNAILNQASGSYEDVAIEDTGKLVNDAINLLPAQQRKVYILSRRNGLRQAEIARELNISLETVKKHMVLALRFLKNHLRTRLSLFILIIISYFGD